MDGLCPGCRWVRRVGNRRGSTFLLCRRAEADATFERYPRQPVRRCAGYEDGASGPEAAEAASPRRGDSRRGS